MLNYNVEILEEIRDIFLVEFEVSKKKLIQILSILPEEFFNPEKTMLLRQSLATLYGFCRYNKLDPLQLILKVPVILQFDHELLEERWSDLKEYFGTKIEVKDLVINSPNVLLEHWGNLTKKLEFYIHEMQVHPATLAKTNTLNYDILTIKDRYEFLLRAGLYQHPSLKSLGPKAEAKPHIKEIAETNIETFISEVVGHGFTVDDYQLFCKMLNEEFDVDDERIGYIQHGHEDNDEFDSDFVEEK